MRASKRLSPLAVLTAALLAAAPAFGTATITIVNVDGPGEGFNDPAPRTPVGGNPGTTLGQQRLIAFQFAADVWGSILDSDVTIPIQASFDPLTCTATSATLGSAGPISVARDFPGAELPSTWYHVALANKLAGGDLIPAGNDIQARFNSNIGLAGCLTGTNWYYGLDAAHGTDIDLVVVLLHEFAHGLGFSQFASVTTGALFLGLPDVYNSYLRDATFGLFWPQMTNAQRQASTINSRKVTWRGLHVTAAVPDTLAFGVPQLIVTAPAAIAGNYELGAAAFGAPLSSPGLTGTVVQALDPADGAGPSTTDGCSPLTNAAAVAGKLAIIDRGTCGFVVKVKNAQDAGALGVIIADNAAGSPPAGLGGADPTIVIPSGRVTITDGAAIKAQLGAGVTATLGVNPTQLAGADAGGRMLVNAPNPVASGSSISHWDPIASPNLLMEPAINADLTHDPGITIDQMADVGWFSDFDGVPDGIDFCLGSDPAATVVIDGCNSGVPNTLFVDGCKISDLIDDCAAGAANHGAFVSCVAQLTNALKKAGILTGQQKGAIQSCAAQADIP
jgi:PA domain